MEEGVINTELFLAESMVDEEPDFEKE